MSRRNSRAEKRKRRLINSLTVGPPAFIDLVQYIKLRERVTTGMAHKIILAGCVRSESHTLGIAEVPGPGGKPQKVVDPRVPAHLKDSIYFVKPEEATA